jgi:uncharacterized membrane protein
MTTLQWLLALHVTGAFLFLGGVFFSGIFSVLAYRAKRPSEVALYLGLVRYAVAGFIAGTVLTLGLGLWLVHNRGFSYGSFWVIASIVLLVAASVVGKRGGEREGKTRLRAIDLAKAGDAMTPELTARLRDRLTIALSWSAGLAGLVILALMIWKPGA